MKTRITFIIMMLMLLAGKTWSQSKQQVNRIATLAKVWGYLKYYHPAVANNRQNWDEEWLKSYLTLTKVEEKEIFNKFIISLYSNLPKPKLSSNITQVSGDSVVRIFDVDDIKCFGIPAKLRGEFIKMYLYHVPDSSRYISNVSGPYKLDYIWHNEEMYQTPAYPDEAHRVLALVRYWNIINYFYPHKKDFAPGWDKVLTDFIPQFIAAKDSTAYRLTFLKLSAQIKDSHAFYRQQVWSAAQGMNLPFDVYYVDGKYVIGHTKYAGLMKQQDFKIGDEITGVNGLSIKERVKQLSPYITGSNNAAFHRNIGQALFKIDGKSTMQVSFRRGNTFINEEVKLFHEGKDLYPYRVKNQPKHWENLGKGIWYVRFCNMYDVNELPALFNDIKDAHCVIWEMRDYPAYKVVQAFLPGLMANRKSVETNYVADVYNPGVFKVDTASIEVAANNLKLPLYKGKLIVLVNEFTQSLAESVSMELSCRPNTVIMGRQTAGATGNMLFTDYPGGIEAAYTAVKVVGLNNSFVQGQGVHVNKPIKLSIKKLRSQPDYELHEAYLEALKDN